MGTPSFRSVRGCSAALRKPRHPAPPGRVRGMIAFHGFRSARLSAACAPPAATPRRPSGAKNYDLAGRSERGRYKPLASARGFPNEPRAGARGFPNEPRAGARGRMTNPPPFRSGLVTWEPLPSGRCVVASLRSANHGTRQGAVFFVAPNERVRGRNHAGRDAGRLHRVPGSVTLPKKRTQPRALSITAKKKGWSARKCGGSVTQINW